MSTEFDCHEFNKVHKHRRTGQSIKAKPVYARTVLPWTCRFVKGHPKLHKSLME